MRIITRTVRDLRRLERKQSSKGFDPADIVALHRIANRLDEHDARETRLDPNKRKPRGKRK